MNQLNDELFFPFFSFFYVFFSFYKNKNNKKRRKKAKKKPDTLKLYVLYGCERYVMILNARTSRVLFNLSINVIKILIRFLFYHPFSFFRFFGIFSLFFLVFLFCNFVFHFIWFFFLVFFFRVSFSFSVQLSLAGMFLWQPYSAATAKRTSLDGN